MWCSVFFNAVQRCCGPMLDVDSVCVYLCAWSLSYDKPGRKEETFDGWWWVVELKALPCKSGQYFIAKSSTRLDLYNRRSD